MSFISLYRALVWAVYRELKACWVVVLCDDIVCVVVPTVLTCGWPFNTVMLHVVFHFSFLAIFTTAKGAFSNCTLSLLKIKVVLEVPYLTHPLTTFLVVMAKYFDAIDLSLKSFVSSSVDEHVWFTTNGTLTFACCQQSIKARVTQVVSAIGKERLSE